MIIEIIFILVIIGILIVTLPRFLVIIPQRHFAIVERFGSYQRTLTSGPNFIIWPIEVLKELRWECPVKKIQGQMGSLENLQLDVLPIECTTRDKVKVGNIDIIDGVFHHS